MARLSRAENQRRNRAKVLAAASAEFIQHGFRDAKIDRIADRAELTRGAVYSNFPSKRALYFTVLAEAAERRTDHSIDHPTGLPYPQPGHTPRQALQAFARAWLARLPLSVDEPAGLAKLRADLAPEVFADPAVRRPYAQLLELDAILLGLALEALATPPPRRRVRVAETAFTLLYGATELAGTAPGFVEPFSVVSACEQLADLDLDDSWPPPHTEHAPPARPVDTGWSPPPATDQLRDKPVTLDGDGVLAIVGLHRLEAIEEAVRAAPPGLDVTAVLVTGAPDELSPLVRLVLAELRDTLTQAVPESAWPAVRLVRDDDGTVAAAAGVPAVSDATETAVYVEAGRIRTRADGFGACHAVGTAAGR